MGVQGEAMGTQLLRALGRVSDWEPTSPMQAGEAAGMDPLEVATAMAWLIDKRLVRPLSGDGPLMDPYTNESIKPTTLGYRYLDEHPPG